MKRPVVFSNVRIKVKGIERKVVGCHLQCIEVQRHEIMLSNAERSSIHDE